MPTERWICTGPFSSCHSPVGDWIVTSEDGRTMIAEVAGEQNAREIVAAHNAAVEAAEESPDSSSLT